MPDYKKMYFILLNEISKALEGLQKAQTKTKDLYISPEDIYNDPDKREDADKKQ